MSDYKKYLDGEYFCSCENTHTVTTKKIIIEKRAIYKIPELIEELSLPKKVFVVCDRNTYEAAGKSVIDVLKKADFDIGYYVFRNDDIHCPDEHSVGKLMLAMEPEPKLLVAVGSGTLNDLVKFCATRIKIPYFVVATAPSMDGFASNIIYVNFNSIKTTYYGTAPEMIIGDINVLTKAPMKLIASGFGDVIGKVPARLDWMIGHLLFDEKMCKEIGGMVNVAVQKSLEHAPSLSNRSEIAVEGLMESLALTGITMQMMGDLRSESGAEHMIAHFLEMKDGEFKRPHAYHGVIVGMTTFLMMRIYEKFFEAGPPPQGVVMEKMELRAKAIEVFGNLGEKILEEKGELFLTAEKWAEAKAKFVENWDLLKANVRGFESLRKEAMGILRACEGPVMPQELGYTREDIYNAIIYCRLTRHQTTLLTVLANWGYLEKYTQEVLDEIFE